MGAIFWSLQSGSQELRVAWSPAEATSSLLKSPAVSCCVGVKDQTLLVHCLEGCAVAGPSFPGEGTPHLAVPSPTHLPVLLGSSVRAQLPAGLGSLRPSFHTGCTRAIPARGALPFLLRPPASCRVQVKNDCAREPSRPSGSFDCYLWGLQDDNTTLFLLLAPVLPQYKCDHQFGWPACSHVIRPLQSGVSARCQKRLLHSPPWQGHKLTCGGPTCPRH